MLYSSINIRITTHHFCVRKNKDTTVYMCRASASVCVSHKHLLPSANASCLLAPPAAAIS
jgi:hypothetical protein